MENEPLAGLTPEQRLAVEEMIERRRSHRPTPLTKKHATRVANAVLDDIAKLQKHLLAISEISGTANGMLAMDAIARSFADAAGGDHDEEGDRLIYARDAILSSRDLAVAANHAKAARLPALEMKYLSPAEKLIEDLARDISLILDRPIRRSYNDATGEHSPDYDVVGWSLEQITGEVRSPAAIHAMLNRVFAKQRLNS